MFIISRLCFSCSIVPNLFTLGSTLLLTPLRLAHFFSDSHIVQADDESDELREHIAALETELSTVPQRLQQLVIDVRAAAADLAKVENPFDGVLHLFILCLLDGEYLRLK